MRILPVGISASNLSVFWPLWDAALLRRYGRAKGCVCPVPMSLLAAYLARPPHQVQPLVLAAAPFLRLAAVQAYDTPVREEPPPELDLHWPSDDPPQPDRIIVVERWLREPAPWPGEFVDLFH
jgi:hypothetical protein